MVYSLVERFQLDVEVPEGVRKIREAVWEMRNSFEHIDERAEGRIGRAKEFDPEALTIFDQPDFIDSALLSYKGYSLNFEDEVITALLECREFIMSAIDARASTNSGKQS